MSKYLFFLVTLTFLLLAFLVSAAPMPWGIALNEKENECAGYWGGDEFEFNPLPDGWIAIYPWSDNWNKISSVEECNLQGKDTAVYSKLCCEKLGYKYVSENIGWGKDNNDNQEIQKLDVNKQNIIEKSDIIIILIGGILILVIALFILFIIKMNKYFYYSIPIITLILIVPLIRRYGFDPSLLYFYILSYFPLFSLILPSLIKFFLPSLNKHEKLKNGIMIFSAVINILVLLNILYLYLLVLVVKF